VSDYIRVFELKGLDENFDDDLSKSILEIHLDKALHPQEAVEKSLYNFDLDTPDGVDRLLELLPILDPEIINEVYQEIFPGYPVDTLAPRMARLELRGYLMDYLANNGTQEGQGAGEEAATAGGPGSPGEEPRSEVPGAQPSEEAGAAGVPPEPEPGAQADEAEVVEPGAAPS